ncbi:tetratricopeptide repeat protein [Brasilonema sp. CT11]|nr:tetratricopeptide repeat protein [Brasilonema sp. CT11]
MNRSEKLRCIFCCSLSNFSRYSLTVLMGVVLLSDSVGATHKITGVQIARQPEPAFQKAIHVMEKPVFQEKQRLYLQGTAESQRQVFEKWQEVLTRQQQIKEREFLDKALAIHKANKDLQEQADRLTQTALDYQNLGETENALKYHLQALEIYRQTKDLFKQAKTLSSIGLVYSSRGDRPSFES